MPSFGSNSCILCHYKFAVIKYYLRVLATYPYLCPTCLSLKKMLVKHNVSNCPVCIEYRENISTVGKCNANIIKCLRAIEAIQFCYLCQVAKEHVYRNFSFFASSSYFCQKCLIIFKSIKTAKYCLAESFYFNSYYYTTDKYYKNHKSSKCCYCIMYEVKPVKTTQDWRF